ncbi:hypothetical protein CPB85DRAFT_1253925 [Mucidula mucida]|nr:hypothetical protein CPB85DRAFT_1253925 [Mucidula mucida]
MSGELTSGINRVLQSLISGTPRFPTTNPRRRQASGVQGFTTDAMEKDAPPNISATTDEPSASRFGQNKPDNAQHQSPLLNKQVPQGAFGRARNIDDVAQKEYWNDLVKRVVNHIKSEFYKVDLEGKGAKGKRNKCSKDHSTRSHLYNKHLLKAAAMPWLAHTAKAIQILGINEMSSNEDDTTQEKSTTRYIHTHPYRSAEATMLIRTIDEEIHNDQLHSISINARGNRPNQRMTDALHSASDRAVA